MLIQKLQGKIVKYKLKDEDKTRKDAVENRERALKRVFCF